MILSSTIAREQLIVAMGLHRLICVLGDGFVFGVGSLIPIQISHAVRLRDDKGS